MQFFFVWFVLWSTTIAGHLKLSTKYIFAFSVRFHFFFVSIKTSIEWIMAMEFFIKRNSIEFVCKPICGIQIHNSIRTTTDRPTDRPIDAKWFISLNLPLFWLFVGINVIANISVVWSCLRLFWILKCKRMTHVILKHLYLIAQMQRRQRERKKIIYIALVYFQSN